jgi:DNA-binding winged helix-turn-helix (wHTH) protein/tetratricopeptide (TPR) repeat protein
LIELSAFPDPSYAPSSENREEAATMESEGSRPATRHKELIMFGAFRLDPMEQQLWHADRLIPLRPKAFAILNYLLEQPSKLISRKELLDRFWGDLHLSDGVLKTTIGEIRQALGDTAREPRFIATSHRRGYRFIGRTERATLPAAPSLAAGVQRPANRTHPPHYAAHFVGRQPELDSLARYWERASGGERQVLFVSGEAGVGKTALVSKFLHGVLLAESDPLVTWGQCIDQYGSGEPYLPIIEAMRRTCAEPGGESLAECLRQNAPTWLAVLPSIQMPRQSGASPETALPVPGRMLREMAETLETLSSQRALVLFLEDLHWADYSTLDLVAYLAQRADPARLLVLGTYRSREAISGRLADIMNTLRARGRCSEISVPRLNEAAVAAYLEHRFACHRLPPAVPELLHRRTEGNPLFMLGVVDGWLDRGLLQAEGARCELRTSLDELAGCVPDSFVRMIEKELERASPLERSVLEAASVAGNEFSTAAVAAAIGEDAVQIEEICMRWSRRGQFLRGKGRVEWRDGTIGERCEFSHVLYQQVTHDRIGAARQAQLHFRIGERLEAGYAEDADGIAAELALHFQRGGDYRRAVRYLRSAGERALRRSAYHEAIDHVTRALDFVERFSDAASEPETEITLHLLMASALRITKGYGSAEVEETYEKAAALCDSRGSLPRFLQVMTGMGLVYFWRGAGSRALEIGEKVLALAEAEGIPSGISDGRLLIGISYHHLGLHAAAEAHLQHVVALDVERVTASSQMTGQLASPSILTPEITVAARGCLAISWGLLGYLDRARKEVDTALLEARATGHPFAIAYALGFAAGVHRLRGDPDRVLEHADACVAHCSAWGFDLLLSHATVQKGVVHLMRGEFESSVEAIRRGIAGWKAAGARTYCAYWTSFLALAHDRMGQTSTALEILEEVMPQSESDHERHWDAELFRVKGELLWKMRPAGDDGIDVTLDGSDASASAEGCLLRALGIAREQGAKLFELRAAMTLCRFWRQQGKLEQGRVQLREIYGWFTEGLDTADLRAARDLLDEVSR